MNKTAFYVVLLALVLAIVYVFRTSEHPPDTGMTRTPKQYIEQLERAKAMKRAGESADETLETSATNEGPSQTVDEGQR
jgi:hypothetical protein